MEIGVVCGDITKLPVDGAIVNLMEGVKEPGGATKAVDQALEWAVTRLIAEGEIKGKLHEITLIHTLERMEPSRIVVAGLGKAEALTLDRIRGVAGEALRFLRRLGAKRVATIVHGAGVGGLDAAAAAQAVVEGSLLGLYTFRKHLTKEENHHQIEELLLVERDEAKIPPLERGLALGRVLAEAANLARDMANEPANVMTPSRLAEVAKEVAQSHHLEITILDRDQMEELGMGALLGVARGASQPPKLIVLHYRGADLQKAPLGLIGKGITFDSGGISIKPSEGLGDMKGDMAGGAAVIAAMKAIAQLKPKINVTAIVPATENLPSGTALKPGDILKSLNGKTIEIISTDAEGRLILADALAYARRLGLSPLVDVATLTGACQVALGDLRTGAFTNNPQLQEQVIKAGEVGGERIWPLPMDEEYKEQNKSDLADIKNLGGKYGGAITAAQFLAEFAEDTPWVHLDIAGTSRAEKDNGYVIKGATGVGVRTLVHLALALAEK